MKMGNRMSELREKMDRVQQDVHHHRIVGTQEPYRQTVESAITALRDMVEETYTCARNAQIVAQDAQNRADPETLRRIMDADRREVRKLERQLNGLEQQVVCNVRDTVMTVEKMLESKRASPPNYRRIGACLWCRHRSYRNCGEYMQIQCDKFNINVDNVYICDDYERGDP